LAISGFLSGAATTQPRAMGERGGNGLLRECRCRVRATVIHCSGLWRAIGHCGSPRRYPGGQTRLIIGRRSGPAPEQLSAIPGGRGAVRRNSTLMTPRVRSRSGIKVLQECLKAQNFCSAPDMLRHSPPILSIGTFILLWPLQQPRSAGQKRAELCRALIHRSRPVVISCSIARGVVHRSWSGVVFVVPSLPVVPSLAVSRCVSCSIACIIVSVVPSLAVSRCICRPVAQARGIMLVVSSLAGSCCITGSIARIQSAYQFVSSLVVNRLYQSFHRVRTESVVLKLTVSRRIS